MLYKNPVIPGFYPDPSICRKDDVYFLVTSSFEYFPGVPVFSSRDLVHWEQIGHCLTRESQLPLHGAESSSGIYAPTIRYNNGIFYMVTTNVACGRNFFVKAIDPGGVWSDPVWIDEGGIDPSLFFDDDWRVYYTKTESFGIKQAEIDINSGRLLGSPVRIWGGTGGRYPEAPHLYKFEGVYYLFIAEGGTEYGHMETVARSATPWGPFEPCPENPVLSNRNLGQNPIQATGHADLVDAHDGSFWAVFLGIRASQYPPMHFLGRETFLAPVAWNKDGWPVIGKFGSVEIEMEANLLPQRFTGKETELDDFDDNRLALFWNSRRILRDGDWSLSERKGFLSLACSDVTLNDTDSIAFIGRRQRHFHFCAAAKLFFMPSCEGEEAGICAIMNERHHYEIALACAEGKREIIVRKTIGDLQATVFREPIDRSEVLLRISGDRDRYYFAFGSDSRNMRDAASGLTRYLSTEVAGGFTGVYIGMYATGNGKRTLTRAHFDWFDYKPLEDERGCA